MQNPTLFFVVQIGNHDLFQNLPFHGQIFDRK